MAGDHLSCDVLLIVATDIERNTLLVRAKERTGHNYTLRHEKRRTYYDLGNLAGARLMMVQCEMGSSGPGASQATVSIAIDDLKPQYAIMVGIAFGVNSDKQAIGEILVSRQLKPYELQRIGTDKNHGLEITSRGDKVSTSPRLLSRLRSASQNWTGSTGLSVNFGLMLSGEKLVDNLDFRDQLLRFEPEAIGGEMEGAGLYAACVEGTTDWVLIKAICDWADGQKRDKKTERQHFAANEAIGFTLHAIEQGGFFRSEHTSSEFFDAAAHVGRPNKRTLLADEDRKDLLNRVQKDAIDPRLHRDLRNAIRAELHLTEIPRAIAPNVRFFGEMEGPAEGRPLDGPIENIFENAGGGGLLILGEPGTGKTNLLLELAESLITRARGDRYHPIPIVFSLARWAMDKRTRSLVEWMKDDLKFWYGLSTNASDKLLENNGIIPLLDGLDEVADSRRDICAVVIRDYQSAHSSSKLVVCSRSEEYERLREKLSVRIAIRVEKLSPVDVRREIGRPGLDHVRRALEEDPQLQAVVDTPLWLHVLYLAATVSKSKDDHSDPRDRLYARYVDYALHRNLRNSPRNRTESKQLLYWLGWLAAEMRKRDQAQFAVEDPDFTWFDFSLLDKFLSRIKTRPIEPSLNKTISANTSGVASPAMRTLSGISVGLVASPVGGWLFGAFVGAMILFRVEGRVEAGDLRFYLGEAISRIRFSLFYGTLFGALFAIDSKLILSTTEEAALIGGLCVGVIAVIFEILQAGFRPRPVSRSAAPNNETSRSLRYALIIATPGLAALLVFKLWPLERFVSSNAYISIARGTSWFAFGAALLGCEKGGWFVLRHYTVRLLLWWRGFIPLAYVNFLNETVERLFLIRRGGAYEFLHLTFRDYMARTFTATTPGSPSYFFYLKHPSFLTVWAMESFCNKPASGKMRHSRT